MESVKGMGTDGRINLQERGPNGGISDKVMVIDCILCLAEMEEECEVG